MRLIEIRMGRATLAALCVFLQIIVGSANALAQSSELTAPPAEQYTAAPGGVDMRTGKFTYRHTDLSAGANDTGGLRLERLEDPGIPGHLAPFANMGHNWDIMLTQRTRTTVSIGSSNITEYVMYLSMQGRVETFRAVGSLYYDQASRSGTSNLLHTGTRGAGGEVYTYTGSDGTKIIFRPMGLSGAADCSATKRCAYPSEIINPDNSRVSFDYDTRTGSGAHARIRSVSSTRGYSILFNYAAGDWNLVSKSCLYNTALVVLPSDGICGSTAHSTVTYNYTTFDSKPRLSAVTDASQKLWGFSYFRDSTTPANRYKMGFLKPETSSPWLVNLVGLQQNSFLVDDEVVWSQQFGDGSSWTYDYDYSPEEIGGPFDQPNTTIAGGFYQNGNLDKTEVRFAFPLVPKSLEPSHEPGLGMLLFYFSTTPSVPTRIDPATGQYDQNESARLQAFDGIREALAYQQLAQCYECAGTHGRILHSAYQITPGPASVVDPLGRPSSFDYCDREAVIPGVNGGDCTTIGLLQTSIDPEGIRTEYRYSRRRMTELRKIAKPGSGLSDIVQTATYPASGDLVTYSKPLTITDANNNTTSYTYDQVHGGILTEVGPAVGGVSPAKKYSYVQRYAWVKNAGGVYSHSANPIWLVAEERSCNSSALNLTAGSCAAGSGDLVVTSYDYGPDAGPNNLLLRGVLVTAGGVSLRTCFGYDALGRKISETSPRGTGATCS